MLKCAENSHPTAPPRRNRRLEQSAAAWEDLAATKQMLALNPTRSFGSLSLSQDDAFGELEWRACENESENEEKQRNNLRSRSVSLYDLSLHPALFITSTSHSQTKKPNQYI
jgi:hypothetical protein